LRPANGKKKMLLSISSRNFGTLPNGQSVEAWTLVGQGGLVLEAITYGGIVTRLLAPDREGLRADVVLGFNDLDSYLAGHPYFGAITGRVAGRITGARFDLDGRTYELPCNQPPNHLHGGIDGFDKKVWAATPVDRPDGAPSLRLSYRSPDGEEGYPGTVDVSVTYTVTADNTFLIETEAVTDRATPFCLTQHSYFNLAGEAHGSIDDHELQIDADHAIGADENMTLLGELDPVEGQGNDFRSQRRLGDAIPHLFQNHGDIYSIRKAKTSNGHGPAPVARLVHRETGRVVEVVTTESHLQLYTGSALNGAWFGKSGKPYGRHSGVCLETQGYPDGVNRPDIDDIILRPGEKYHRSTAYVFSTCP
jgi:aldose 1-epimerase